jgi:transcriptional regulator with XRE-family HTH domain
MSPSRAAGTDCLRPVEESERPALQELGSLLALARQRAGLTQRQLAYGIGVGERHVQRIEAGHRRTRLSTLADAADFLSRLLDADPDGLLDLFVQTAGDALAPESQYADKVARRRVTRARRRMVDEMLSGDKLARIARRRSLPEEKRRAARATAYAMRERAGLLPYH